MARRMWFAVLMFASLVLLSACRAKAVSPTEETGLPNPASVYCEEHGGKLELRQDAKGNVTGVCVFPDGIECEEWAYYRGECKPSGASATKEPTGPPATAEATAPPTATAPSPTALADDGCRIYRNMELGYSLHYPADATLSTNDDPLRNLQITGPLEDGDHWPSYTISHPSDREEYCPPEGVDLEQWLVEHNMLPADDQQSAPEARQPDLQIAGVTAIHLRFDRSPQSYAYDRYYFAKAGQLYMVLIGHTGDKEDWELYNHFLASIQFEP